MISYHVLIHFTLHVNNPASDAQNVAYRTWRRLLPDVFTSDLAASKLCGDVDELNGMSIDDLVQLYSWVLTKLLDKHYPCMTVRHHTDKQAPLWFLTPTATRRHTRAAENVADGHFLLLT